MPDRPEPVPARNGTTLDGAISPEERSRILTTFVAGQVDQGYLLESQTDTEAVLTTRGPKRWFGLRGRMPGSRRRVTIDEHGRMKTRKE